jgi:hypothetical protein
MSKNHDDKKNETPQPVQKPRARFWCESTVNAPGSLARKSLDCWEGIPGRINFPEITYHGKKGMSIYGEEWVDEATAALDLLKDGGMLRYDPQQIIDSGLLSFDQVVDVLGGDTPLFWVQGPAGIEKVRRKLVNTQAGEVAKVEPGENDVLPEIARMSPEEVKDAAFAHGLNLQPRISEKKAKQQLFDYINGLSPERKRAGMKKYKALMAERRSNPTVASK